MSDDPEAKKAALKRKMRTYMGLGMIAFGVIGAVVGYVRDSESFDLITMLEAKNYAIVHLVIWTIGGLACIGWARLPPDGDDDGYRNNTGSRDW